MLITGNEGSLEWHTHLLVEVDGWDGLLLHPHNGYARKIKRLYVLFTRQWQTVTYTDRLMCNISLDGGNLSFHLFTTSRPPARSARKNSQRRLDTRTNATERDRRVRRKNEQTPRIKTTMRNGTSKLPINLHPFFPTPKTYKPTKIICGTPKTHQGFQYKSAKQTNASISEHLKI